MPEEELLGVRFEFLIGDEILRGKIKSHLIRYSIGSEQTLDIEYFLAIYAPQEKNENQEDDWISVITPMSRMETESYYAVGLYNGEVSIYDYQDKLIAKQKISEDPIKAIKIIPSAEENQYYLISGGIDETGRIHKLMPSKAGFAFEELATLSQSSPT